MPYVIQSENNEKIEIYYEVHGSGEPVVLHHGNGNRSSDWHQLGYIDALKKHFQLILIDLRGYGNSSKPHNIESYSLKNRANDTVSVLDELDIQQAHFFGASFGASIGFLLAKYFSERFKSYIFATPGSLFQQTSSEEIKAAMLNGADAYLAKLEEKYGRFGKPFLRETFLANDGKALWASNSSEWFDYMEYVNYVNRPSLIYVGEKESTNAELHNLSLQLTNCRFVSIDRFDHVEAYWRSDIVAPIIKSFLDTVST